MRRLGRFVLRFLAFVGLATLLILGVGLWAALSLKDEAALPPRMVLSLDLEARFHEVASSDPLATLSGEKSYVLRSVIDAIDRAGADKRVVGLFATLGHSGLGMAGAQEVRAAVARFRASGKPAVVFAETVGEFGAGTGAYYLATAFDHIWLQPSGDVGLTGIMAESPFLKGTLDMLGIKAEFAGRHEFKSAIEVFTEKGYSGPHQQNLGRLLDSWTDQMVEGIAEARRLPADKVRALYGKGPFLAAEALSVGLVDQLGYRDAAFAAAGGNATDVKDVDIAQYAAAAPKAKGAKIAVITGTGAIHRGKSDHGFNAAEDFGAETVGQAFRDAMKDPEVKAILFRVDSPGGSYVASDTVWNEVRRAREVGKPVVVSMGNTAASGGYFVAMAADRVLALPGTITGSIGVFSGKMVLADFWQRFGISWDEMHRGDNAPMWSFNQPFSPQAWERMNTMLDRIYADFTGKAIKGRGIPAERIDQLARGRIWSGADAREGGLVDQLGGWFEAYAAVREVAKLAPDAALQLTPFPRPKSPWQMLAELLSDGKGGDDEIRAGLRALKAAAPILSRLEALAAPGDATLRMPPVEVR